MVMSSIVLTKVRQRKSLEWIRRQSLSNNCVEILATHDTGLKSHVVELLF